MEKSFLFVVALASIAGVDLVGQEPATQVPDEAEARAYVERLLKKHAFFAQVDYEVDTRHAPFVFCVERPTKAEPGYLRRVVNAHSPYLKELAKVFEQDYAKRGSCAVVTTGDCWNAAVVGNPFTEDMVAEMARVLSDGAEDE